MRKAHPTTAANVRHFVCVSVSLAIFMACGAFYAERTTPLRPISDQQNLEPAPPEQLMQIRLVRAVVPERTRDGRAWGSSPPDAFGRVVVDGTSIIDTPVQKNTLRPQWAAQGAGNYFIAKSAQVSVQLWDSDALNDQLICNERISDLNEKIGMGEMVVTCSSGARVWLLVESARAKLGLGLRYEVRDSDLLITAVARHSPASRAGIETGDVIVKLQGKDVQSLSDGEAQSLINANSRTGLSLTVRSGGKTETIELKEGPVYLEVGADAAFGD